MVSDERYDNYDKNLQSSKKKLSSQSMIPLTQQAATEVVWAK
jgi:hypothetical protein